MGATRLPTLDQEPVLNVQQVASKADGYEAFGQVLGKIAGEAGDKAIQIEEEQSNASFLQSAAQADTIKTDAQINMLKHPDQAGRIAEQSASTLDTLTQSAFVNKKDRQKLAYMAAGDLNDLRLKAAHASYEQSQKSLSISYWDQYPVTMKSIQDALDGGDFEKAKTLEDSLHQASLNAAQIGAISPEQYASVRKSSYELYSRTKDLIEMAKNPNGVNAATYHAAVASPFGSDGFSNTGFPVDANTQWMAGHYSADRTMAGQYAALYNGSPINWGVVAQGTEHEYNDFKMQMMGVNQIKGAVNSGMPFAQIENRMQFLNGKAKLSPMEQGEFNYWKSFKNQIQHGDGYLQMMSQTSMGGQYAQDYNQKAVAIENSPVYSPDQRMQALRENYNDYLGKMVSLGQAQHIDPNFIRPIPQGVVSAVQSSFQKDAPVTDTIRQLSNLNPEYRAYLADSMAKPNQKVSVFLSGATLGKADVNFQQQLIEANQERDYSGLLKTGKNETQDNNIWQDISSNSNMTALSTYLAKLPGGVEIQGGLKTAAVNYVLYRAAKEGDTNLNGKAQYEQDFINNVAKGFDVQQGNRYVFNGSTLNLRKADMDFLADYAISQAYKGVHQGRSEHDFQSYVDLNPLHATNTPDGRIVVIDKNGHAALTQDGHPAFDHPYTTNMLNAAHANAKEIGDYMHQYFGFTEEMRRNARLHPGFPFSIDKEGLARAEGEQRKMGKKMLKTLSFGLLGGSDESEGQ